MRDELRNWIADADTRHSVATFGLRTDLPALAYQDGRLLDLYTSLVGELFDLLREVDPDDDRDWATVGNGLSLVGTELDGATRSDAFFFSAASYYAGGFSASAYVTMRRARPDDWSSDTYRACFDLLARPLEPSSERVTALLDALRQGTSAAITQLRVSAEDAAGAALGVGADEWVSGRVFASLLDRFVSANVRAVLPGGDSGRWTPLVTSFLERRPPVWDFFPSQIEAIDAGLLGSGRTFSLQMPTGAGKTALTETLIYDHLTDRPDDLAVLLVPFRSLARELRGSMARRLTDMGFPTRTVYGGTVPTAEETQDLDTLNAIIATPEALTGLLGIAPELLGRLSLVVCDEGHLLDSPGRGIGLELLLSRFLAREDDPPRMVFVSAIVPNIEEVNSWLGGGDDTVVRSEFRPADAEYAVLRSSGHTGRNLRLGLEMRAPAGTNLPARVIPDFLSVADFEYFYEPTKRLRTWTYDSFKTQAIAAARKALPLGTVAVFAATKTGTQGVLALAEELANQLAEQLRLPVPNDHTAGADRIAAVSEYLTIEYGSDWVGTTTLAAGAVVHHGDIPQETREALEETLVARHVRMVLCTSTLAEGVNLPIRTLVLYTTQRRTREGDAIPMLARDIRNLVGRAGRAGSSTKGLVICANPSQWDAVSRVADGEPGERVDGALRDLLDRLAQAVRGRGITLTNLALESNEPLYPLVDGIDATLIELLRDDVGDEQFREIASSLAASTYAYRQSENETRQLLGSVFALRADRLTGLRDNGRLGWASETGARVRLVDSIIDYLVPSFDRWGTVESVLDEELLDAVLAWAWRQQDLQSPLRDAYPDKELIPPDRLPPRDDLLGQLRLWLLGSTFAEMAAETNREVDLLLRIHSQVISYALTTLVEQAIAVLEQYLSSSELGLAEAVVSLPDYIRFGVSKPAARSLMADGVRHRRAAHLLGADPAMTAPENLLLPPRDIGRTLLEGNEEYWRTTLGEFVFERTRRDLSSVRSNADPDA